MPTGKTKDTLADRKPAAATAVRFTPRSFVLTLTDGRELSVPLSFYPTLAKASPAMRNGWELIGDGRAICWDDLDLHLCVQYLLEGAREGIPRPPKLSDLVAPKTQRRRSA